MIKIHDTIYNMLGHICMIIIHDKIYNKLGAYTIKVIMIYNI